MRILMFSTGGTIAAVRAGDVYTISMTGDELVKSCPEISGFPHRFELRNLFVKGGSNIEPEDWGVIARCISEEEAAFDAAVVSHGTDTLAYTAAALSFLLLDFPKPVVVTGAMIPPGIPFSDAGENLLSSLWFAALLADSRRPGVSVSFGGRLIHGPRASKINSWKKKAFESIDYPDLGRFRNGGGELFKTIPQINGEYRKSFNYSLEKNIAYFSLFPGFCPHFLDNALENKPKAFVLEGFGVGGMPYALFESVKKILDYGIPVFVRSQVPFGGVDLTMYELGRNMLNLGVTPLNNMTREASVAKLMLLSPHKSGRALQETMLENFCDDVFKDRKIHSEME